MKSLTLLCIIMLTLSISACGGKSHNKRGYQSQTYEQQHDAAPASYPRNHQPRLPSGHGGKPKTGKPYTVAGKRYYPLLSAEGYNETGTASWYGSKFHGKKTANGERYDMYAMSAAHTTLPMPSMVRVTNLNNGRSVVVRVNDRGPFAKNRLIDLSYAAARSLGYDKQGTAPVRVEALGTRHANRSSPRTVIPQATASPLPSSTDAGAMYIQLGAFASASNARRLQQSLQDEYPSVRVYARNGGYREIYRVRIGPFSDVKHIERQVLALQQHGYRHAIVVVE